MGQRRNDEIVAYATINNTVLREFDTVNFPEPKTENQTFRKPLQRGTFSAGGPVSYDTITAARTFEPGLDDVLLAILEPLQGVGTGSISYHDAPGYVVAAAPMKGKTYDITLLTAATTEGVDVQGDKITQLTCTFGVNGTGK